MRQELILFQICIVFGIVAWGAVCRAYIWPQLKDRSLAEGAKPLLYLHLFRYLGLMFMISGVVSVNLPAEFGFSAGWGDFIAALLAGLSLLLMKTPLFQISLWVFNLFGLYDLLHAFYEGRIVLGMNPADLGAAFIIPIFYVPLLIWTHIMMFVMLLRKKV